MTENMKILKGRYYAPYRLWKIMIPYGGYTYLYAGTKMDAERYMRYLKKKLKNPYSGHVKEIKI